MVIYPRGLIGLNKAKCGIPGWARQLQKVNKSKIEINGPKKGPSKMGLSSRKCGRSEGLSDLLYCLHLGVSHVYV